MATKYNHRGALPMQLAESEFSENYRALSDEDIAAIYADIDSLTDDARVALLAELQTRGLTEAQLQKLHAVELRHEAQFDRLERFRRKKLAWGRLPGSRREWILAILLATAFILISDLMSRRH